MIDNDLALRSVGQEAAIAAKVPGKPLSASEDAAIMVDTGKLQLLERAGSIRWQVKLNPGETKTVTYKYERYVPSR